MTQEIKSLEKRLDEFVQRHQQQLKGIGCPEKLWPALWARLETGRVGTIDDNPFTLRVDEEMGRLEIVTNKDLTPPQCCLVYRHSWTYTSREEAKKQLDQSKDLRQVLSRMIESLNVVTHTKGEQPRGTDLDTETIMNNLYRIAFQFQIKSQDNKPQTYYSVCTDPFSPALLPYSETDPLFQARTFIHTPPNQQPIAMTILFPSHFPFHPHDAEHEDEEDPFMDTLIPKDTVVTRSELTPAPDYSTTKYWQHLYDSSQSSRSHEWFVPWKGVSQHVRHAISNKGESSVKLSPRPPVKGAMVLNVGCGGSTCGKDMILDGTAGLVVSFDVVESVVKHAVKASDISKQQRTSSKSFGVEEFLVSDGTQLAFRESTSFDWALDKGTTDGLLCAGPKEGVELMRKVWDQVSKYTCMLVWISLGRPENRILLIEDELASGWEVDQCLEVDIPVGKSNTHTLSPTMMNSTSTLDKCWVYVCLKKK